MLTTPNNSDIPKLKTLWHNIFEDDPKDIDEFFKILFMHKNTLICKANDKVVSMLYMLPYEHSIYLYALATLPNYRGRGIMTSLINEAFKIAKAKNAKALFLIPATGMEEYYKQFGFAPYNGSKLNKNIPPATEYEAKIKEYVQYQDETFIPKTIMVKDFGGFNIHELFGYIPF